MYVTGYKNLNLNRRISSEAAYRHSHRLRIHKRELEDIIAHKSNNGGKKLDPAKIVELFDANIRFADYTDLWLKNYGEKHLAPKTFERYKALLVRINAALGNIRLDRLQPHHITEFLDNLEEEGIRETTTYTATVDLRALLKEKGYTRQALADAAGIGVNTAYVACRGKSIAKH